jgi:capsular polysaccharide biosynthesis protein
MKSETVPVVTPGYYHMNRKALVIAAIFLVVALVFPVFVIFEDYASTTQALVTNRPNLNDETQRTAFFNQVQTTHNLLLTVLLVIEAILIVLFAVSMLIALKSPHEKHAEHEHFKHD